jgi:hypothetical protein
LPTGALAAALVTPAVTAKAVKSLVSIVILLKMIVKWRMPVGGSMNECNEGSYIFLLFSQREDANKNVCKVRPRTEAFDLTKKQLIRRVEKRGKEKPPGGVQARLLLLGGRVPSCQPYGLWGGFFTHCETRYGHYCCGLC